MTIKENFEVGAEVTVVRGFHILRCKILEVDNHPFEYAQLRVEMLDSPATDAPSFWTSSKYVKART